MKKMESLGLRYDGERLFVLDQTCLPSQEIWIECETPDDMIALIQRLAIRGAPLIGVAAALALAVAAERGLPAGELRKCAQALREARPTAVNLMNAIDRLTKSETTKWGREAEALFDEDVRLCSAMAELGASLIKDGDTILTHCNTGGLATVGCGTALGVIRRASEQGKRLHVFVDETRPLLQGARLTTWELEKLRIPFTLIADNMAGFLMASRRIDRVLVGADRIAANGDAANKIGTYSLAVLARHHGVPFHVVAPRTTFDADCASGREIPIEERAPTELRIPGSNCEVWNPAFDVTPRELITSIVLDDRIW